MNPHGRGVSLDSWLAWLQTLSPAEIDLGLKRVLEVLERLSLPPTELTITVGGTNGKGSSVVMLEALLRARGYRTGCYTSPHVLRYNERMRIDGMPADDAAIVAAFEKVEAAREQVPLTYFEFGTLAALCLFAVREVDAAVLEVGLGGRLDAVNAIEPDATLITNVTLDHCDWLGDDIESIAAEKAGILRGGKPAVFGADDAPRAIIATAERLGTDLRLAGVDFDVHRDADDRWSWRGRDAELTDLAPPALPGLHQVQNAAAVLALLEAAGLADLLDATVVDRSFAGLSLPGRMQSLEAHGRRWLLDGAHNAASAEALADALNRDLGEAGVTAVVGILDDKDARSIVATLAPVVEHWIATAPDSPRAIAADALAETIRAESPADLDVEESVASAIERAVEATPVERLILIVGSFYTVGAALSALPSLPRR